MKPRREKNLGMLLVVPGYPDQGSNVYRYEATDPAILPVDAVRPRAPAS